MIRNTLIAGALASLSIAASATAAQAPTLGPVKIIKAGQTTPVAIGGNNLPQGATIRKGTELRRWLVTIHGRSNASVTLKCGPGAKHIGLGQQDSAKVHFALAKGSDYGRRSINVRFFAAPGVDADGAQASVYALCKK